MKSHKFTIFPFLNTNIAAASNGDLFPLYYRLTYMRKNTMLRSFSKGVYADLEGQEIETVIETESQDIRALMALLTEKFTEPYDLPGIRVKYEVAQTSVLETIDQNIRDVISENLKSVQSEFGVAIHVGAYSDDYPLYVLMNAIEKLMPKEVEHVFNGSESYLDYLEDWLEVYPLGIQQPRIIDWLDISQIDKQFLKYLSGKYDSEEKVKEIMEGIFNLIITKINMPM